jgi:hypothetical protein
MREAAKAALAILAASAILWAVEPARGGAGLRPPVDHRDTLMPIGSLYGRA